MAIKKVPPFILRTPAPDEVTQPRHPSAAGLGMNNFTGRSSDDPGKSTRSALAQNLMESSDDGENVLGRIISGGLTGKRGDALPAQDKQNWQERQESAAGYRPAFGCDGRVKNPSEVVPPTCGFNPNTGRK
jgi:hypothetical protein